MTCLTRNVICDQKKAKKKSPSNQSFSKLLMGSFGHNLNSVTDIIPKTFAALTEPLEN